MDIKTFLEHKITYSWYKNAKIDYNINGKFLDCSINENRLSIIWEERKTKYQMIIPWYKNFTFEQIYDIWMEQDFAIQEIT